jgi:hypothetical protein
MALTTLEGHAEKDRIICCTYVLGASCQNTLCLRNSSQPHKNTFLRGWSNDFDYGDPRKAFRNMCYSTRQRMVTHINRRSQRKYHRPKGMSHYQYLQEWVLLRL